MTTAPASHQIALSFEDGVTRFIRCAEDQTVADASYRSRINIPLDCRDGACGTCKALCESGEYDGGAFIEDALSAAEAADGFVLPCSMKPRSDLVLQIASTSEVAKTRAATYTGVITRLERLSPTTTAFTVEIPERDSLAFLPGQYVNVAVPGTAETRSYSFSSAPDDKELSFLVKLTPGGVMSTWLAERATVGDEVAFTGPHGSFFLREAERPLLLLAGGTGLAPILSILQRLRDTGSTRPTHLVYGVSTDDDLVELDRLAELAATLPSLTWDHCVSDPGSAAANKGFVTSLIRPEHLYDGDVAVYLCGPPPMVESVRTHLADTGVVPTGFYYEKFALSGSATPAAETPASDTPTSGEPATKPAGQKVADAPPPADTPVDTRTGGEPATERVTEKVPDAPLVHLRPPVARTHVSRAIAGQEMLPASDLETMGDGASYAVPRVASRDVAGQEMLAAGDLEPLVQAEPEPVPAPTSGPTPDVVTTGGYEIGEEHPSVFESDAIFEARQALELGALELVLGRLTSRQVAGYRLLAEGCVPFVEGDRFVDAAAYTETNAAFHDYLFTLTGNEHLLQAYQALGVKGHMEEVLRTATWCDPRCAQDHLDIVDAVESGDRQTARALVADHAGRSKATMRRAMQGGTARKPAFVTPGRFDGKVVVITGAAQGIGEHTARRIAAEGGTLVLADRSDLVTDLAGELEATAVTCDLEQGVGARAMVEEAVRRFGRVDVLVNNVGGAINFKPFTEFTDAEIAAEVDRSLMTTLHACRAVLPGMVHRGRGVIVNVSSAATRGIHRIPYSAAKGGINAITASLALEYADAGVRVVATAPGGTEAPPRRISRGTPQPRTERERAWYQAHIDQTLEHSPMRRYGTLDEQAAAITFLASDEASYITGTVLPVAGGDPG